MDLTLIHRSQAGDEEAFAALFQRYKNLAYKTAYLMLGSADDAEDALQEVFIQVYKSLSTFQPSKGAFTTWLHRITVNHCLNQRRKRHLPMLSLDKVSPLSLTSHLSSFESRLAEEETVRQVLSRLSKKQRAVVILRYYWDLSYAEMAQILDVPVGTVKSRMNLALRTLRKELETATNDAPIPYLDGQVTPSERTLIQAHLAGCDICRRELAALSATRSRVSRSLQIRAAQAAPSPQAWSRLQARLAGEACPSPSWWLPAWLQRLAPDAGRIKQILKRGLTMKKGFALAALAALVIAVSTVALVPSVRAQVLKRVLGISAPAGTARLSETPIPGGSSITATDTETGETKTMYLGKIHETIRQTVSWDEAQAAVDFSLRQPAYLPEGAELTRVELVSVPDGDGEIEERCVVLWYVVGDSELALEQRPAFPEVLAPPPGVTAVTVNGAPGWTIGDENTILTWQTAEARYNLDGYLPLEEMLKIAESLK